MKRPLIKNLSKRLEKIEAKQRAMLLKSAKDARRRAKNETDRHNWSFQYLKRAERPLQDALPLRYLKRRNLFVNYKESCAFDPVSGSGHSYRWYELTKVIRGKLVLNTYSYSNQTAKHVRKMESLFGLLGLKSVSVQAPRGLQDLDACRDYHAKLYGEAVVSEKYARKKSRWAMSWAQKGLKACRSIGITFSASLLARAVENAEEARAERNRKARENRIRIVDNATEADRDKAGYHILEPSEGYLSKWKKRELARDGLAKGFKTVWIHRIPG